MSILYKLMVHDGGDVGRQAINNGKLAKSVYERPAWLEVAFISIHSMFRMTKNKGSNKFWWVSITNKNNKNNIDDALKFGCNISSIKETENGDGKYCRRSFDFANGLFLLYSLS